MPLVSVIMPLYNKETTVRRAVTSLLSQTLSDFELIVVNDGSTDKGPDVLRAFEDTRIRLINQSNKGVSAARNKGIEVASADLIAFLDADDEWKPDFLETIIHLRDNFPSCQVFGTSYFICCANGLSRPATIRGLTAALNESVLQDYFTIAARSDPPLWTSAVAVYKEAIDSVGGFPAGVSAGEDLITWAKLALKFEIAYCREPKAFFWEPVNLSDRPGRVPDIPDIVGEELARLIPEAEASRVRGVKEYVALWHRMRAVIFVQLGEGRMASKEIQAASRYAGMSPKLYLLALLAGMPSGFAASLFKYLRTTRAQFRKLMARN